MKWKWKPQQAESYGWAKFLSWAEANGVDATTQDDGEAWWDCWTAGSIAGGDPL